MASTTTTPRSDPPSVTSRLRIDQMDCPTEEALIRKRLDGMPGVHGLEVDLVRRVLTVDHAPAIGAEVNATAPPPGRS